MFMHTLLSNHSQMLELIKDAKGNISGQKVRQYQESDFVKSVIRETQFLPENASFSQRIFCLQNNITSMPVCELTGDILKWNANKKQFSVSRKKSYTIRDNKNIAAHRTKLAQQLNADFEEIFRTSNYQLLDINTILQQSKKYTTCIKMWDLRKDPDYFCSLKYHTAFLDDKKVMWGERLYCLRHNINALPTDVFGQPRKYINSRMGYTRAGSAANRLKLVYKDVEQQFREMHGDRFELLDKLDNFKKHKRFRIKCKQCNTIKYQLFIATHWRDLCCNTCSGFGKGRSKVEDDISNFLKQYNIDVINNYTIPKTQLEIDILIPKLNIGIEYDGILWHSIGTTYPRSAHREKIMYQNSLSKFNNSLQNGIKLITIFENEWLLKQPIVKSVLLSKCGLFNRRVYARQCQVKIIDKDLKGEFLNENHIQGNCQSFYNVGLYLHDELLAVMTLTRRKLGKNKKNNQIELARFCSKLHTQIIGGLAKLLTHCRRTFTEDIVSYCDKRYSNGESYKAVGFQLVRQTPPNYYYTNDCITLESRQKYQKHKLTHFPNYDANKTESEIMYEAGFRKIYDRGNYVFQIKSLIGS